MVDVFTTTTQLADSVKPLYVADYLLSADPRIFWQQLLWKFEEMGAKRGDSIRFPIYESIAPVTSTISEDTDVESVSFEDSEVAITFGEYGMTVTTTERLNALAYTETDRVAAQNVGRNLAESLDLISRKQFCQGSYKILARGATRASIRREDVATYAFLSRMVSYARSRRMPSFEDGFYATIVHPNVAHDLLNGSVLQNAMIQNSVERLWNGELGSWSGVRIIVADNGRVFYGAGVSEVATTVNDATVAAGDTVFTVTSATGLAAGDTITVGTLESGDTEQPITEQVEIVSIAGSDLTIRGEGTTQGNTGFKYAHANGVAVTKAPNVYAIPLVGPQSIAQASSSNTGHMGQIRFTGPFDKLGRKYHVGWYGIWGFTRVSEKWVLRGEVASSLG
jgi:N4-gp56 family major capsid protein